MRQAYWVDSVTFVAEGFMSKAPWDLKGRELTEAFVAQDAKVTECITSSHVRFNRNGDAEVMLVSTPYDILIGKHVVFLNDAIQLCWKCSAHIILSALCLLGAVQGNATRHPLGLILVFIIPVVKESFGTV